LIPSLVALATLAGSAMAEDPHLDPSIVPGGCSACHAGHGESRSPMLPAPQVEVCLSCHGTQASREKQVSRRLLAPGAEPQQLSSALERPFVHPISEFAYSRHDPGAVTCTSCHSPHRSTRQVEGIARTKSAHVQKRSTMDPSRMEFELCEGCHGGSGPGTRRELGVSARLNPRNRSYHPVEAPSREGAPSVLAQYRGREINCTDCHGASNRGDVRGPHGSSFRGLLRAAYSLVDGSEESESTYGLCYACHDRSMVLDSTVFPEHRGHVVEQQVACATCHEPHGSVENRAMIRFGDRTLPTAMSPSLETGRLAFESSSPGQGACYLTCHGYDHAPAFYGQTLEAEIPRQRKGDWPEVKGAAPKAGSPRKR
jgi:predicted CXXCH cytochrome family protein